VSADPGKRYLTRYSREASPLPKKEVFAC
jgi:hypothetical protein